MNCIIAQFVFPLPQSGELKPFVLSWSEKLFTPAFESVTAVAPVTPLLKDPVALESDPDTFAE